MNINQDIVMNQIWSEKIFGRNTNYIFDQEFFFFLSQVFGLKASAVPRFDSWRFYFALTKTSRYGGPVIFFPHNDGIHRV